MTGFNPFQDVEGPVTIDVVTPEAAPLCLGSTYTFSQGQRQLISDYVTERFQGDVRNAFSALAPRLSPAQLPNWDLTLRARASEWANERVAGNALSEAQCKAAAYFVTLLMGIETHRSPTVNAQLARLDPSFRKNMAMRFDNATTKGAYQRERDKLFTYVKALSERREETEPSDEAVFGEVKPGSTEPF